jgi:hypothetical protein
MKFFIYIIFIFYFELSANDCPVWFNQIETNKICGFGSNKNEKIAVIIAKADYIKQFEIKITTITRNIKSQNNNSFKTDSLQSSEELLNNVLIVKNESIDEVK